jgi:hypothetical protein
LRRYDKRQKFDLKSVLFPLKNIIFDACFGNRWLLPARHSLIKLFTTNYSFCNKLECLSTTKTLATVSYNEVQIVARI